MRQYDNLDHEINHTHTTAGTAEQTTAGDLTQNARIIVIGVDCAVRVGNSQANAEAAAYYPAGIPSDPIQLQDVAQPQIWIDCSIDGGNASIFELD